MARPRTACAIRGKAFERRAASMGFLIRSPLPTSGPHCRRDFVAYPAVCPHFICEPVSEQQPLFQNASTKSAFNLRRCKTIKIMSFIRQWPSRLLNRYLRANDRFPICTAVGTSAVLWVAGDTMAQTIEARGEDRPLDMRRLVATSVEGSLVNGGVGCLWYKMLDKFTTHRYIPWKR
jgi:hypothetical protein